MTGSSKWIFKSAFNTVTMKTATYSYSLTTLLGIFAAICNYSSMEGEKQELATTVEDPPHCRGHQGIAWSCKKPWHLWQGMEQLCQLSLTINAAAIQMVTVGISPQQLKTSGETWLKMTSFAISVTFARIGTSRHPVSGRLIQGWIIAPCSSLAPDCSAG